MQRSRRALLRRTAAAQERSAGAEAAANGRRRRLYGLSASLVVASWVAVLLLHTLVGHGDGQRGIPNSPISHRLYGFSILLEESAAWLLCVLLIVRRKPMPRLFGGADRTSQPDRIPSQLGRSGCLVTLFLYTCRWLLDLLMKSPRPLCHQVASFSCILKE